MDDGAATLGKGAWVPGGGRDGAHGSSLSLLVRPSESWIECAEMLFSETWPDDVPTRRPCQTPGARGRHLM